MKKALFVVIIIISFWGCLSKKSSKDLIITKIETEYKSECFPNDSCIIYKRIYYNDGSLLRTYYIEYPKLKIITYTYKDDKLIYEIHVSRKDSIKYQYLFNDKGDEIKYIEKDLINNIPNKEEDIKNFYDNKGRLHIQINYDDKSKIKEYKSFSYDTLGYSVIEFINDNIKYGEFKEVKYYKNNKLIKLKKSNHNRDFEYSYDTKGNLIYEDPIIEPQIRRFYKYENGYIKNIIDKIRIYRTEVENIFLDEPFVITEFKYEFDKLNRPIKIIKTEIRNGKRCDETIILTEYKN